MQDKTSKYLKFAKELSVLLLINSLIAILLFGIGFAEELADSFLYSQIIGVCIFCSVRISYILVKDGTPFKQLVIILFALIGGSLMGTGIVHLLMLDGQQLLPLWHKSFTVQILLVSLLCGTIVSYLFISQKKIQEEKIIRLAREKEAIAMELKLLQAQVEPHFLFNTLATIHSLLATDPDSAAKMLLNLTDYLRTSLALSRVEKITVSDEMAMIKAYLEIFKIRMGKRLKYEIKVDKTAAKLTIPPMLIQPLVENSIKHGLEPSVEGGEISIAVSRQDEMLKIEIGDTGQGVKEDRTPGLGTTNVLKRVQSIYGESKAIIDFSENKPQGLMVKLLLPVR